MNIYTIIVFNFLSGNLTLDWERIQMKPQTESVRLGFTIEMSQLSTAPDSLPEFNPEPLEMKKDLNWKPPSFAKELWYNARDIFSSNSWKSANYKDFAKVALALYLSQELDRHTEGWVNDWHREAKPDTTILSVVGEFGDLYSFVVIGGFYASGKFRKSSREIQVARDSLMASIIAAGIITPTLKVSIGRKRP